jgi:uncharacterized Zn finger protein
VSPRDRWDGFTAKPKKPPPAEGIKIKKVGTTWWGQRWIGALELVLRGDAGRLARGRTYARAGRTHDLTIEDGKVRAKVTGSAARPYVITIRLDTLQDEAWSAAIAAMAERAQFAAELLAGQMPLAIDEAFQASGTSLFPKRRAELKTECSCPDWGDPCKHVAATHYVLGDALDRDPFLLFELRGRSKARVLEALRSARAGNTTAQPAAAADTPEAPEIPTVSLGPLSAAEYDRPRQALPTLHLSFEAPRTQGAVLRQLGTPATWHEKTLPSDLLGPLIAAAAQRAREIALGEQEPSKTQDAPRDAQANKPKRTPTSSTMQPKPARKPTKAAIVSKTPKLRPK